MQKPANHKGVDISDVLKGASEILGHAEDPYPVKMTVRFTELQHEALRKEAFRSRQAISAIVRNLIDAHIVRTPKG